MIPAWAQVIVGAAAVATAVLYLWTKVLRPMARAIATADEVLPVLKTLTGTFKDAPHAFDVLLDMSKQFRTDSGSSLRDVVNRLEAASSALKISAESAATLAADDRNKLAQLVRLLDVLTSKVAEGAESNARIEDAAKVVASDLEAAHTRADVADGPHGAAADAYGKSAKGDERGT